MTWFQSTRSRYRSVGLGSAVLGFLLAWPLFVAGQDKKDPPADPAAKQAVPADKTADANKELAEQIRQMSATVARLEAALKQDPKATPAAAPGETGQAAVPDKVEGVPAGKRIAAKFKNCAECHAKRPSGPLPASHLESADGGDKGAKQEAGAGAGGTKTPADGKAAPADKGMSMTGGKGMAGGKGMGMGMMAEKKAAGMGMMGAKKGMEGMEGGKAGMEDKGKGMMGGKGKGMTDGKGMTVDQKADGMGMTGAKKGMGTSATVATDAPTIKMMEQKMKMMELKMQMLELKMQMMETGAGTDPTTPEAAPAPHATHTGTPDVGAGAGVPDKTPDPGKPMGPAADADLLAQVRELHARIAKLETATKQGPK